ncbi:MAG: YCF48-related protein [Patescibacteria group bacterium]
MIKKCVKILLLCLTIGLVTTGCSINFSGGGTSGSGIDGGIFRSNNKGDTWLQKTLIPTVSGQPKNFSAIDSNSLAMDPSDNKAIYYGSVDSGLFYSYDSSNTWRIADGLGRTTISNVAVDPKYKCIIYATIANKLYKSSDCNRNWAQVYFDNDLNVGISALAIDNSNNSIVYIGTSRGEIIRSSDRGASWQTINRFENRVAKIIVSQSDSKLIFVATNSKGIFRSTNAGETWVDLSDKLKEFDEGSRFQDLIISESDKATVFLATRYGLLKSADNGNSWKKIELITPEDGATINSIAVSPKNAEEIYYVTNTTFYRSIDNGQNWTTKKLPTTRAGWKLLIDPKNENFIYLAVRQIQK